MKCPELNCTFESTEKVLKLHLKSHIKCDKCDKSFSGSHSKQDLKRHEKTHAIKKVHECHICKSTFDRKSYLDRHLPGCEKKSKIFAAMKGPRF